MPYAVSPLTYGTTAAAQVFSALSFALNVTNFACLTQHLFLIRQWSHTNDGHNKTSSCLTHVKRQTVFFKCVLLLNYGPLILTLSSILIVALSRQSQEFVQLTLNLQSFLSVCTSSNHLNSVPPIFQFLSSLPFKIFCNNLKSSSLITWLSHSNLPVFIPDIM